MTKVSQNLSDYLLPLVRESTEEAAISHLYPCHPTGHLDNTVPGLIKILFSVKQKVSCLISVDVNILALRQKCTCVNWTLTICAVVQTGKAAGLSPTVGTAGQIHICIFIILVGNICQNVCKPLTLVFLIWSHFYSSYRQETSPAGAVKHLPDPQKRHLFSSHWCPMNWLEQRHNFVPLDVCRQVPLFSQNPSHLPEDMTTKKSSNFWNAK